MKKIVLVTLISLILVGCEKNHTEETSFKEAHDSYETVLTEESQEGYATPTPPEGIGLELVQYESEVGQLDAYVSVNPQDNKKHPIVIWVVGGWGNSIDKFVWSYNEWGNDQSGQFISEAGILMMYPSFRGGNENPGNQETLYGEVNDIYSAYEYAKTLPYVDPERIYLIGHSTGATRVLLASEYDDKFRAVFAFGPVDDISKHNKTQFTFDLSNKTEAKLRSPKYWMQDVKTPTFVIEGEDGNSDSISGMRDHTDNENLHFYIIDNNDHFSYLAPVTKLVADKIIADTSNECNIEFTDDELIDAVSQEMIVTYPKLKTDNFFKDTLAMDIPAYWTVENDENEYFYFEADSQDDDINFWNSSYIDVYREKPESDNIETEFDWYIQDLSSQYDFIQVDVDGLEGYQIINVEEEYVDKYVLFHDKNYIYTINFGYYKDYSEIMNPYVDDMVKSIKVVNK